jgi:hypothetical protein
MKVVIALGYFIQTEHDFNNKADPLSDDKDRITAKD